MKRERVHLAISNDTTAATVQDELENLTSTKLSTSDARRWTDAESAAAGLGKAPSLLVIDAGLRPGALVTNAPSGKGALALLHQLKPVKFPILLVLGEQNEELELEVLRSPKIAAWRLGDSDMFATCVDALLDNTISRVLRVTIRVGPERSEYLIEGPGVGQLRGVRDLRGRTRTLAQAAQQVSDWSPIENGKHRTDWQSSLCMRGYTLAEDLLGGLGPAVAEAALRDRLELRFVLEDSDAATLFPLPFEALNHNLSADGFFCRSMPMARRIARSPESAQAAAAIEPLRIVFVDGSVPAGVAKVVPESGAPEFSMPFEPLQNIVVERNNLDSLSARNDLKRPLAKPRWVDSETCKEKKKSFQEALGDELAAGCDVLHFSGHSIDLGKDGTFLVVPSKAAGRLTALSIRMIAGLVRGKCPLVLLSSCRGSSVRTALEMAREGGSSVIGFRWDVDDEVAAIYVKEFYLAYVKDGLGVPGAYHAACRKTSDEKHGVPVWASAIALVQD